MSTTTTFAIPLPLLSLIFPVIEIVLLIGLPILSTGDALKEVLLLVEVSGAGETVSGDGVAAGVSIGRVASGVGAGVAAGAVVSVDGADDEEDGFVVSVIFSLAGSVTGAG